MLTSATNKCLRNSKTLVNVDYRCYALWAGNASNTNSRSKRLLCQNWVSSVNKGKNMLHKLSLDAIPIGKNRTRCIQIDFRLVSEYC